MICDNNIGETYFHDNMEDVDNCAPFLNDVDENR